MKVLIVDDEPLARRELRRLLSAFPSVSVVGEAADIDEAHERIAASHPTLVFLDVQMPGGTGFDLLERLDCPPQVVFTTAYDRYAVQAFEVNALDYLLKPIEPDRMGVALEKARKATLNTVLGPTGESWLAQIFVRDGPRCWFVPVNEISLFSAEGNYVRIHWGQARPLLNRSLAAIEARLDTHGFFRANRQQILNLEFVQNVEVGLGGRLHVELRDGTEVEVSRRQARLFRNRSTV
ncbi:MAG TPA: LytTR family DNA-binding domain-containing protein [Steroidobacteraceae bacterium]|jgi:two-component system LytT family response regulator